VKYKSLTIYYLILLTVLTFWIYIELAANEPYFLITRYDLFTQIGVSFALMILLSTLMIWLFIQLYYKKISKKWIIGIVWIIYLIYLLIFSYQAYLYDLSDIHGVQ